MADNSPHAQLERQCDRLTNENVELLRALGEAKRELAIYTGFWKEECRRTVHAVERQIEAERELGAVRPVLEALKAWLRATNPYDAWGPRDRLRKLGYAWMRAEGERNDLYDRLRARAKRWKRLAKKQRAEAWSAHFDQALADSREIVALRLRAMAWKRLAQRLWKRA